MIKHTGFGRKVKIYKSFSINRTMPRENHLLRSIEIVLFPKTIAY